MGIIFILFLLMSTAKAGVNFSGLSGDQAMRTLMYDIPEFNSRADAIKFANREGYSEQLRRALNHRMQWLKDLSYLGPSPTQYQIKMASYYSFQYEYCGLALKIVEDLKKNNVGSVVVIGMEPIYK